MTETRQDALRRLWLGIFFMCVATTAFPIMNGIVQVLSRSYPSEQIIWARTAGHLVVVLLLVVPRYGFEVLATRRPGARPEGVSDADGPALAAGAARRHGPRDRPDRALRRLLPRRAGAGAGRARHRPPRRPSGLRHRARARGRGRLRPAAARSCLGCPCRQAGGPPRRLRAPGRQENAEPAGVRARRRILSSFPMTAKRAAPSARRRSETV